MLKGYLTCETVAKLVPFYIDDKLPEFQSDCVAMHLRNCPGCMQKYATIKKFIDEVKAKHNRQLAKERLHEELSAHYDGEGNKSELLKTEVKLASDEEASRKYEQISYLGKLLSGTFRDIKAKSDIDYVEKVMQRAKKESLWQKVVRFVGMAKR